jgi:hypothetical protein
VNRSKRVRRVLVSADGSGVVSHAGVGLLRELAEGSGLVEAVTAALVDTLRRGLQQGVEGLIQGQVGVSVERVLQLGWGQADPARSARPTTSRPRTSSSCPAVPSTCH